MQTTSIVAFSLTESNAVLQVYFVFCQVYFVFRHNLKILFISCAAFRDNPPFVFML